MSGARAIPQSWWTTARATRPRKRRAWMLPGTAFTRLTTGLQGTRTQAVPHAMTRRGAAATERRQNRMPHASEWLAQIAARRLRYVERRVTIEYTACSLANGQRLGD